MTRAEAKAEAVIPDVELPYILLDLGNGQASYRMSFDQAQAFAESIDDACDAVIRSGRRVK